MKKAEKEVGKKITVGVCVMEKKVKCSVEVVYFGDKAILEDPIESGYPLKKAETYASLRRPFLVNELEPQYLLHDRTKVYENKIVERLGLGDKTYMYNDDSSNIPFKCNFGSNQSEAKNVIFGAIDYPLVNMGVKLDEIGIVIANCSPFNRTPSLSSMIVNH
ncbi:hypothetical protein BC332_24149 [Capsicum chinense]|nr:hypothetical protein BC332_24149 [Capsicum chinense]